MITFSNPYLYVKGTCDVTVCDPQTGDIVFSSNKVQTSQITTSVDAGTIRAGLGNGIAIQTATDAAVNLTLTAANFSLAAIGLQVGSTPFYSAPVPVCESVKAETETLRISGEATAPLGFRRAIAYVTTPYASNRIGSAGKAWEIGDAGEVKGFAAAPGETYLVHYWKQNPVARQLTVYSAFAPAIMRVTLRLAVYSAESKGKWHGHRIGWLYYTIPRMQFGGDASVNGDQTAAATTAITGTALSYEEAAWSGACLDWNMPNLAYVVYVPSAQAEETVVGLISVGGVFDVKQGTEAQIPVKYVLSDGTTQQPDYSALTFTAEDAPEGTTVGEHTGIVDAGTETGAFAVAITLASDPTVTTRATVNIYRVGRALIVNGAYALDGDENIYINRVNIITPTSGMAINEYYIPTDGEDDD